MTDQEKIQFMKKIETRSMTDIVKSLELHKIDFFSMPKDLKMAIVSVYVAGAAMMYELPKEGEKGNNENDF